jgi:hypothetical protein
VILATHLHLMSRLRMSGVVPLLPQYAFVGCIGATLPFMLYLSSGTENTVVICAKIR